MNTFHVRMSRIGRLLPYELIEYIWLFNHDWAAKIIQKNTKKFISNKVSTITEMIKFAHYESHLGLGMYSYKLFYRNRILNSYDVLTTMNACKCCARHQINKPKKLSHWSELQFNDTQHTGCKCNCRHLSRFLCRVIL